MPTIDVTIVRYGDPPCWPDAVLHTHDPDPIIRLAAIEGGMQSGATSLALRLDHPDVRIIAETSLAAWIAATCALRGAFPEAFAGTPLEGA